MHYEGEQVQHKKNGSGIVEEVYAVLGQCLVFFEKMGCSLIVWFDDLV